jgi:hypothetical protein
MFRDLSDALKDLVERGYNWTSYTTLTSGGRNRAQAQGSHLEAVVKDILCGIAAHDAQGREKLLDKYLAFQGIEGGTMVTHSKSRNPRTKQLHHWISIVRTRIHISPRIFHE